MAEKVRRIDCGKVIDGRTVVCAPAGAKPVPARGTPLPPFNDLRRLVLVVKLPPKYKQAIDCHGREESCANVPGSFYPPVDRTRYIEQLKQDYNSFPAPLRTDNLVKLFSDLINRNIAPWIQTDETGKVPDLVVIDRQPGAGDINIPGTLVITIKLSIDDMFTPEIGILTNHLYRFDKPICAFDGGFDNPIAIPFDLPEEAISDRLNYFAKHSQVRSRPPLKEDN